jgi:hypothetical protein
MAHPLAQIDRALAPETGMNPFHPPPLNKTQLERLADGLGPDLSLTGEAALAAFAAIRGRNLASLLERRARLAAKARTSEVMA